MEEQETLPAGCAQETGERAHDEAWEAAKAEARGAERIVRTL